MVPVDLAAAILRATALWIVRASSVFEVAAVKAFGYRSYA
jgi:hypothetical protein